jgi:hypothetical protein
MNPNTSTQATTPAVFAQRLPEAQAGTEAPLAAPTAARPNAILDHQSVLTWRVLHPNRDCLLQLEVAATPSQARRVLDTGATLAWREDRAQPASASGANATCPVAACPAVISVHATEAMGADVVAGSCVEAKCDRDDDSENTEFGLSSESASVAVAALCASARPSGRRHLDQASVLRFWEAQAVANLATCGRWL